MNQLIKQIATLTTRDVVKTYALLDSILEVAARVFQKDEISLNQNDMSFTFGIDNTDYKCDIITDINTKSVVIQAATAYNTIVAECVIDIFGSFNEKYARIDNVDVKTNLVTWFTDVSNIDVKSLSAVIEDSSDVPTADVEEVPADEIKSEDADTDDITVSDDGDEGEEE